MRIISLDLGSKSLGVCLSDKTGIIATPLENFMFESGDYDTAANRILEIVDEYEVELVLLGHPLRQDGTKSDMTLVAEDFFEKLKRTISNVEIKLIDERYSTQRGVELLKQKYGNDEQKLKNNKDMAAAYVMLYDYLNR